MNRAASLSRLNEAFDIAIIGGGATGLGAAVEAASRGYKVALLEANDFAKGTSSRSTKLVHGGVRYLAQGNIGLVRDALRERGRLRRNAPHLVGDLEFIVPAYAWWNGPYYGTGLKLYDVLAGKYKLGKTRILSRAQVLERIPTLEPDALRGGILYFDGQFDDARLAITLALTADDKGAVLLNHAPVRALLKHEGRTVGVVAEDLESGKELRISAKVVINAAGIFADRIRKMDDPDAVPTIAPSQGIHLVLPADFLPGSNALMVPRTDDGRVLFVVPWHRRALVGTTDTPVDSIDFEPRPHEEEIEFLLEHACRYLARDPTRADVLATYVGLRPLVRPPKEKGGTTKTIARDHSLFASRSALLTIVGGKWTTYRKMGEDTIDHAEKLADFDHRPSVTAEMPLHAAPMGETVVFSMSGTPSAALAAYGTDADKVRALAEGDESLAVPMHPRLPYLTAEVVWAARMEMARNLEDVLARRTRALILDARASLEAAPAVVKLLARELGRDDAWQRAQLAEYRKLVERSLLAPLPAPVQQIA